MWELFKTSRQVCELKLARGDGTHLWVQLAGTVFQDEDGNPVSRLTISDITDRKKEALEELRKSEEKHRLLFETMAQGVIYRDSDGKIISANPAAERIFGLSLEQMQGKTLIGQGWQMIEEDGMAVPGTDHPAMIALRTGQTVGPVIKGVFRPDKNNHVWLSITAIPLFKPGEEKPYQAYSTFTDITRHKQAEEALIENIARLKESEQKLKEAREEAEQANRAKSIFLANMSHEVRNPLNVITGMTGLLCEANLAGPLKEYACMARDSADHLLAIINDILNFSRIDTGKLEIVASRVKLAREVESIVLTIKNQAAEKGLEFLYHFDGQLPEEVLLDPGRLKQVLINLIDNAIKFTREGTIELHVWLEEGESSDVNEPGKQREIAFAVKDTGPGIFGEEQNYIFGSFNSLDQGEHYGSSGTGLGLAISKNLVELMGGRLWLESKPGEGSAFYFTLPCIVPEEAKAEERAAGKAETMAKDNKKTLTLLLAEDKPMNQRLVKVLLEQMDHKVEIVANGKEAVEAVKAHRYDAVIMDINMPGMNGIEATEQIRAWEKKSGQHRTMIIAMTAYAMKGDREKFLITGMDDYISKPIDKKALTDLLKRVKPDK